MPSVPKRRKEQAYDEVNEHLMIPMSTSGIMSTNSEFNAIIPNTINQVLVPENSGVRVIFPRGCSPLLQYQIKCQVSSLFCNYCNTANDASEITSNVAPSLCTFHGKYFCVVEGITTPMLLIFKKNVKVIQA